MALILSFDAVCVGSPVIIILFYNKVNKQVHTTPACFSTFYQRVMVPTLVENSKKFCVLVFFSNNALKMHALINRLLHMGSSKTP